MDTPTINPTNNDNNISESMQCKIHLKEFDMICFTCHKTLCSLCMCLERHPTEHIFFSSNSSRKFPLKNVLDFEHLIQTYIDNINNSFNLEIDSKISQFNREQEEQIHFLSSLLNTVKKRYETLNHELLTIKHFKYNFKEIQSKIISLLKQLSMNEIDLNKDQTSLQKQINEISKEIETENERLNRNKASLTFHIDMFYPNLSEHSFTYEFKDFEKIINNELTLQMNYIDSYIFHINLLDWFIRIYPFGHFTNEKSDYVWVCLCISNPKDNVKFKIHEKFTLINEQNTGNNYTVDNTCYKSKDDCNMCKLYLRNSLKTNGFINEKGSLVVSCSFKEMDIDTLKQELIEEKTITNEISSNKRILNKNTNKDIHIFVTHFLLTLLYPFILIFLLSLLFN